MRKLKEKRTEEIINSAIKVFTEKGYFNGTIDLIAETANIGKGTVYQYFKSKQDLFQESLIYIFEIYHEKILELSSLDLKTRDKFLEILSFNESFMEEYGIILDQSRLEYNTISPEFKEDFLKLHKAIFQLFLKLVEEGQEKEEINPDLKKEAVVSYFLSIIRGSNNKNNPIALRNFASREELVDIIFKGIGKANI